MARRVFISYKKEPLSIQESQHLRRELIDAGYEVFLDVEKIGVGTEWQENIYREVRESDVLIVLLEPKTVQSEWVQRELDLARGIQLSILPVRLGNKDFSDKDIAAVQKKLVIDGKQYGLYCSEQYIREHLVHLTDPEKEVIRKKSRSVLTAIDMLADETHRKQHELAKRILARPAQNQATAKARHHSFPLFDSYKRAVNIHLATGDLLDIDNLELDVIVNSENDYMQMARFFENHTLSSRLRQAGAYNHNRTFLHDRIQEELDDKVADNPPVAIGQVLVTSAGHPESLLVSDKKVRYIFHASTNQIDTTTEYPFKLRPVKNERQISDCVRNCLHEIIRMDNKKTVVFAPKARFERPIPDGPIKSIAFPIFGTGHGGLLVSEVVPAMMRAMIEFIQAHYFDGLKDVYLCVYSNDDVERVKVMMQEAWNKYVQKP